MTDTADGADTLGDVTRDEIARALMGDFGQNKRGDLDLNPDVRLRITSYNVCYTKLLRRSRVSITIMPPVRMKALSLAAAAS